MPLRRRQRPPWLAALAGGFLGAALLTAAALWLYTARGEGTPSAPPPAVSSAAPVASPAKAVAAGREAPAPAPAPEAQPVAPPAAATAAPEPLSAATVASRPAPSAPDPAPATSTPEPPAQREAAPRRAELADGTVLVLQGIAITDGRPVALVNGVALGPGERVEGFTVQSIDAMRIELRRGNEVVTLALR